MALTLAEAAKLSNDVLQAGVIETVVKESPVLQVLPFIEIVGNGLTYNRENAAASAAFFDVGDTWTEDTPTFTQQTATLKILGGDADIDNFLTATRSNVQDLEAAVVHLLAPAPPLPPTPCAQSHTCATLVNIGCRSVLSYKRINRTVWCVTPSQGGNYS